MGSLSCCQHNLQHSTFPTMVPEIWPWSLCSAFHIWHGLLKSILVSEPRSRVEMNPMESEQFSASIPPVSWKIVMGLNQFKSSSMSCSISLLTDCFYKDEIQWTSLPDQIIYSVLEMSKSVSTPGNHSPKITCGFDNLHTITPFVIMLWIHVENFQIWDEPVSYENK